MEQLAPVIAWFKKHGFWVVCGVIALAAIGGMFYSGSQMEQAKQDQIKKYKKGFRDMKSIASVAAVTTEDGVESAVVAHPNAVTAERMEEQLEETVASVLEAWKTKRDNQVPLLTFPKELLGEATYAYFARSNVPEEFENGQFIGADNEKYLRTYREQIPKYVSKIARNVDANWEHDEQRLEEMKAKMLEEEKRKKKLSETGNGSGGFGGLGGPGGAGAGGGPGGTGGGPGGAGGGSGPGGLGGGLGGKQLDIERNKFTVIWGKVNQALWHRKLTEFRDWDDNARSSPDPTILQAYILQQDIWLLEAMFDVVKEVNGDATTNAAAVIKDIDYVAFGREARADLGTLTEPDKRLAGIQVAADNESGPFGGGIGGFSGGPGFSSGGASPTDPNAFDANGDQSPFHGRYVNAQNAQVTAEAVRNAVTGETLPETGIELIISKRVPFRLGVKMDERRINQFLAACANSPLAFEVEQVRINRHEETEEIKFKGGVSQRKSISSESGGGGPGGLDGFGGFGGFGDGLSGGGSGSKQQKLSSLETTPVETRLTYDVKVEFYGIVKIYNPVRENFLRKAIGLPEKEQPEGVAQLSTAQ